MWENPSWKILPQIWNSKQNIDDVRFSVFLTVHGYLMIFGDANLTMHSIVYNESNLNLI